MILVNVRAAAVLGNGPKYKKKESYVQLDIF